MVVDLILYEFFRQAGRSGLPDFLVKVETERA